MQSKDTKFGDVLNHLSSLIGEVLPNESKICLLNFEEPTDLLLNESLRQFQVPMVYKVDSSVDRSLVASFQHPYPSKEVFLADILSDVRLLFPFICSQYETLIKPYEEPFEELNKVFEVNVNGHITDYVSEILEEGIDNKQKEDFYAQELQTIFQDVINKDVEKASLRLMGDQIVSCPQYNVITGKIKEPDTQSINDEEFDKLLEEVGVPDQKEIIEDGISQDQEHKLIFQFLESSQNYIKNPLSEEEEQKNDLEHLSIDQILLKKKELTNKFKEGQENIKQQSLKQRESKQNIIEKPLIIPEESMIDTQSDEIDVIVQDSHSFKQAIQINKDQNEQNMVVMKQQSETKSEEAEVRQHWYVVDNLDMKRFKEMIPHPAITYPFELDDFQKRAIYRLEQGNCVFVAAHTSAGKTVVAEYAIALAFKHMTKTIYTSPIKALSNQKYREFKDKFGDVGIQTGDVTLNNGASCVIMTTEILQEMLYNDSDYLKDVEWVIFDEVHYINDPERGSVWEEVIMKLPEHIQFVMLSATVPNYKEFADWVGRTKRKQIYVQMTEKRPVPLQHMILFKDKLHLIKDEFNNVQTDTIQKVLKEETNEFFKKRNEKEAQKKMGKDKQGEKDGQQEKAKEIDFKEKAMKAKEKSIQKIAMKGQKQAAAGGKAGPNSQNKNTKKYEKFYKHLITISREKLLPCVVFCFSRAACEDIPLQLEESLEFTTGAEKGEIKKFWKQKLQRLSESDRKLPQIVKLKQLLIRGIGMHHAGLLPLVKEIIEILFADGYLKVVFATTTFAIGLNMPARSVFFTQVQKFNGTDMELLQTSEYLQMAGRAGRRGKDPTGTCLLSIDRAFGKPPTFQDFEQLLENRGTPLQSKLKLSYQMTMNVVKSDDMHINDLLKTSFFENESEKERVLAAQTAQRLQVKIAKAERFECTCGDKEQIMIYHSIYKQITDQNRNIMTIGGRDVVPLCIVEIFSPQFILEKVVVLQDSKQTNSDELFCLFIKDKYQQPPFYEDAEQKEENKGIYSKKSGFEGSVYYEYIRVPAQNVFRVTSEFIDLKSALNIQRDQLPTKILKDIIAAFLKIKVFKDWKLPNSCNQYLKEKAQLFETLKQFPTHKCEYVCKHLMQIETLKKYEKQMTQCKLLLNEGGQEKLDDFKAKIQVLIHYKYLDYDLNLLFRGKVAQCFQSVDKFLITELLFSGILKELTNEEMIAVLSILNTQNRNSKFQEPEARISETFQKAKHFLGEEALKLLEVESKFGVADSQNDISTKLDFNFYEIIYEWANQKPFIEVVKLNNIDEGSIVKTVQSVERICRQVKNAARIIGDAVLAQRMEQAQLLIKRDIIFTPSLYLE